MKDIPLWQVELSSSVAFFDQTVIKIINNPDLMAVPYCHPLMQEMLISENQWIPLLRFHETFECVVVVQVADKDEYHQLAITAHQYPSKRMVTDAHFISDVQAIPPIMRLAACSVVRLNEQVIPIIDPNKLLNDTWLKAANSIFINRMGSPKLTV